MIRPLSPVASSSPNWQRSLAEAIRNPDELLDILGISVEWRSAARRAAQLFPLMATQSFVRRMQPQNPGDPLLRQVLPLAAEHDDVPTFVSDPVEDASFRIAPGVLQKYAHRALLIVTGNCAVHCRYCFRRHYPYEEEPKRLADWEPAFARLAADQSIDEVILSGGDPLMLPDLRLAGLIERIATIPHIKRLRIHSRLPVVLPDRVTTELIGLLTNVRLTPIMVVHANHAAEIVEDAAEALGRLVQSGITTLNQAVLLKEINDSFSAQRDLCLSLVNLGVLPYYLHQLDRVAGAAHFEVAPAIGSAIINQLRASLPGYAVPTYVQEIPDRASKTPFTNLPAN